MISILEDIIQLNSIGERKLFPTSDIQLMILKQPLQQKIFWEDDNINNIFNNY